jgi:hypothetical protein
MGYFDLQKQIPEKLKYFTAKPASLYWLWQTHNPPD